MANIFGLYGISLNPFASSFFFLFFFFFRLYESRNTRESGGIRGAIGPRTRGTRSPRSLLFFFIFFCFFFCNSMLSVRVRVSRLRLSSTSHYVRAKKISREFHTSFSHSASATFSFLSFLFLFSGIARDFEITVCIKSSRTFNGRSYRERELFARSREVLKFW